MATDTAHSRKQHIWQLPVFLVGLAAAAGAYSSFPAPPEDPSERLREDLTVMRVLLDRRPMDLKSLESVQSRLVRYADSIDAPDDEFRYLLGSALAALAEYGDPAITNDRWQQAVHWLREVPPEHLEKPTEQRRLSYRLAKALAATGQGNAEELMGQLTNPPIGEDEAGERPRLLAEVAMRLPNPDLKRAKSELTNYLASRPRLQPEQLDELKLMLGKIHVQLNEPDKARTWLREVSSSSQAEVKAVAQLQLARLAEREKNFGEAVEMYESILGNQTLSPETLAEAKYRTGLGLVRLKNPSAAAPYFEQTAKGQGPMAVAANVRLAELAIRDPESRGDRQKAIDRLELAVSQRVPAEELEAAQMSLGELQAAFEEVIQVCLNERDFAAAVRTCNLYGKVSSPGRHQERRAEVNAAWAALLTKQPGQNAEANQKFREAATDYLAVAEGHPAVTAQADLFRRAADALSKAGDMPKAIAIIDRVTSTKGLSMEAASTAWLNKAEYLLLLKEYGEAEKALQMALEAPGATAAAARVKLATLYLDQAKGRMKTGEPGQLEEARKQFALGQDLLTQVANRASDSPQERDAQQQALFELGKLLLQQSAFADAEARFRQLLQLNPTGNKADQGKLYLGSCLLLLARGDHQGGRRPHDADRKLTEAVKLFEELSNSADPFIQAQADIRLANSKLLMKNYDQMPELCERLAQKYAGKPEELIILSMLYMSQRYSDRMSDAARTIDRMQKVYDSLSDKDFPGGSEEYTREYWKKYWFDVVKNERQ